MSPRARERLTLLACALLGLGVAVYVVATLRRPAGPTEAELLTEASRIWRRLPLYVEPEVGALDDGPLAFRKHALYTPLWSAFLGLLMPLGGASALAIGRLLAALAWFVGVPLTALRAARGSTEARAMALLAFAGPAGMFFLVRAGVGCNVDPIAVLLAAVAFANCLAARRVTPLAAVLFAGAVLLKPHVAGIGLGVALASIPRRDLGRRWLGLGVAVALAGALGLYLVSGGAWPRHMLASSANPWSLARFVDYLVGYGFALGLPHLVFGVALLIRGDRLAGAGVLGSTVLAAVLMGKLGSATNYWLEPTAALAVALAAHRGSWKVGVWAGAMGLVLVAVALDLGALPKEARGWVEDARTLERARRACTPGPGEVWSASDPMLEYALAGRVTRAPWQLSLLVRAGKLPVSMLASDLAEPRLTCFAMRGPGLESPPGRTPVEDGLYDHELWAPMREHFERVGDTGVLYIYRRRAR